MPRAHLQRSPRWGVGEGAQETGPERRGLSVRNDLEAHRSERWQRAGGAERVLGAGPPVTWPSAAGPAEDVGLRPDLTGRH